LNNVAQFVPMIGGRDFTGRHSPPDGMLESVTLPHESVQLLCEICRRYEVDPIFRFHSPSMTAAEKMRIVGPAYVQKTLTVRIGGHTILCTCLGDPILSRQTLRRIAEHLGLARSAAKNIQINPQDCEPMANFEMAPGMVSPFLRPGRTTIVRAIVLVDAPDAVRDERSTVAVSLALRWSLMIDLRYFSSILRDYAMLAYPEVRWIDLRNAVYNSKPP
jgi:hypothetical protein